MDHHDSHNCGERLGITMTVTIVARDCGSPWQFTISIGDKLQGASGSGLQAATNSYREPAALAYRQPPIVYEIVIKYWFSNTVPIKNLKL